MDSYSALFTAGLLNCSTPRASLDLPLPSPPRLGLAERRRTPPPTPLIIPPTIPAITTTPARPSPHFAGRKTPRASFGRRRSLAASPHAALKSPARKEMRSRELQAISFANRRARERESAESAAAGGRKEEGGLKVMWTTPVAAISRLRRRNLPLSAPSPPPSKPLPALPSAAFEHSPSSSPTARSLKGVLPHLTNSSDRKPLSPIEIPQPMKSFFFMDEPEDEEMEL
ncbi:hypothetical protein CALVIDRAFT_601159 [Calocera viscosa TUFC12733]|uniref:Uncharacterized protein n=1 Tax=Calocera viscosa (strain TUFC12733) TaxID=1330018 RepID=A0A167IRC3_CALVF|nr:hypothetical protein CALVIDRAFT_601159 [Calocera viscosa TUFC12733]